MISLGTDALHVWLSESLNQVDDSRLDDFAGTLTDAERGRAERHAASGQYARSVLTRFMARDVLSRYADTRAADGRFIAGEHGKPEIAPGLAGPQFNVSHTRDRVVMVVCAVSCGIDIEAVDRDSRFREVAERYFSVREAAALRALDDVAARRRFIETWTLKEAFVKALGLSLIHI